MSTEKICCDCHRAIDPSWTACLYCRLANLTLMVNWSSAKGDHERMVFEGSYKGIFEGGSDREERRFRLTVERVSPLREATS